MHKRINIANVITASRIIFAILIVFSASFSIRFYIFYLLGAFSDMIDGTIARKRNLKSSFGAKLDTIADSAFMLAVIANILPNIYVPRWLWIWIIVILMIKIVNFGSSFLMFHRLVPEHTIMNKVTGFLLFFLPFCIGRGVRMETSIVVIAICSVATVAAIQEGHYIRTGKEIE